MKSMTGFGRAEKFSEELNFGFRVELSSINRKQFDLKLTLPKELTAFDTPMRAFLGARISRGSLSMRVELFRRANGETPFRVDFSRMKALLAEARKFCAENGLPDQISFADLVAIPDAVQVDSENSAGEETLEFLKGVAEEAVEKLIVSRANEGSNLKKELLTHLLVMESQLEEIIPLAKALPEIQKEKLCKRLRELELPADENDERLLREIVIYGDRLDVSEEVERLHSHFANFRKMLESADAIGRALDFMVQEIFRECNTLGNKAASTEISPKIVAMKTELEKIREQVQNIE